MAKLNFDNKVDNGGINANGKISAAEIKLVAASVNAIYDAFGGTVPTDFFIDGKINPAYISSTGPVTPYWTGKSITFFGDSFTASDLFATTVSNGLELSGVYKDGLAGSTVTPTGGTKSGVERIDQTLASNATEAMFILMGTNDWAASIPLGTINDPFNYTVVNGVITSGPTNTFFAALKYVFSKAVLSKPGRVFASTMMVRTNESSNYAGQSAYSQAIKDVAALYSIPVYDMLNDSGVTYSNIGTYTSDGVHPDTVAGKSLISGVIKAFLEQRGTIANGQPKLGQTVLTITGTTADTASMSFTSVANAERYSVQRSSNPSNFSAAVEVAVISGTTHTDTGLSGSTNYYYRIIPVKTGYKPGDPSAVKTATTAAGNGMQPILGYIDRNSNLTIDGNNISYPTAVGDFGMATHNNVLPSGWVGTIEMDGTITNTSGLFGLNENINGSNDGGFTAGIRYNRVTNTTFRVNGIALGGGLDNYTDLTRVGSVVPKLRIRLTGTRMFVEYSLNGTSYVEIVDSTSSPIAQPQVPLYIVGYLGGAGMTLINLVSTPIS